MLSQYARLLSLKHVVVRTANLEMMAWLVIAHVPVVSLKRDKGEFRLAG